MLRRDPRAPSRARRVLGDMLRANGIDTLRATAELVTSELVSNVLLHTDSDVTIQVTVGTETCRVEIEDDSPVLPVGGILDPTAACGRGLVLVERLSHRWGVISVPSAGKRVWFELVAGAPTPFEALTPDELLEMWDDDPADGAGSHPSRHPAPPDDGSVPSEDLRRVRVGGIGTELLNASKSHLDDLIRDLTLATGRSAHHPSEDLLVLGARLRRLAVDLLAFRNEVRRQALDAAHRHAPTLTLEMDLPVSLAPRLADYSDALDLADELCAAGRLLLAPAPVEHVRFRRWKLGRIIDELSE